MASDQGEYAGEAPNPGPEGVALDAMPSGFIVFDGKLSRREAADLKRRFLAAQGHPPTVLPSRDDGGEDPRPKEV